MSEYVPLTGLEFTMWIRLASNSQRFICLCLQSAGIKDVYYQKNKQTNKKKTKTTVMGMLVTTYNPSILGGRGKRITLN